MEMELLLALEVRKLTEVVMRLTSSSDGSLLALTKHCENTINECKEMLYEVRTSQKELSKLLEGAKVFVIGDASGCPNQSTTVNHQESSSLEPVKIDQPSLDQFMNQQQHLESADTKDVVGRGPGPVTSNELSYEMPSQTNLKLIQLVEAAAIQVERENMQRGTPMDKSSYDHHVMITPSQVVPESIIPTSSDKRLCCTSAPSPSIHGSTKNDNRMEQRRAGMDIMTVTPPNRPSYPLRTPPEKLLRCEFCPRLFEHHHSAILHMRSCRKKHDESSTIRERDSQENRFTDLITVDPKLDSGGSSSRSRRSISSEQRMHKMIKCGHCERTFPTQHQVSSHERVHTGLRPYSCHVCGVKFAHGGNMIKHIKSKHPSEKPYMCRYCQNNFKTHADVLQHRKLCAVHRALLKDRSESSSQNKKSRTRGREGEDTVTASEDENSRPSASAVAKLPPHSSVDTKQIEFNVGSMSTISLMEIKMEVEEPVVTTPPASSLGHTHNLDVNAAIDESEPILKTLKSEISDVPDNQYVMARVKDEVDLLPD